MNAEETLNNSKQKLFAKRFEHWAKQGKDLMIEGDALDLDAQINLNPLPLTDGRRLWDLKWAVQTKPKRLGGA